MSQTRGELQFGRNVVREPLVPVRGEDFIDREVARALLRADLFPSAKQGGLPLIADFKFVPADLDRIALSKYRLRAGQENKKNLARSCGPRTNKRAPPSQTLGTWAIRRPCLIKGDAPRIERLTERALFDPVRRAGKPDVGGRLFAGSAPVDLPGAVDGGFSSCSDLFSSVARRT